jgi:hypothetical protein
MKDRTGRQERKKGKFTEIFAGQGAPPVSTTPEANFATSFASFFDTNGKFATGVNTLIITAPSKIRKLSQSAGFEPAWGNPIGFRVQRLNHSATTALDNGDYIFYFILIK